MSDSTRPLRFIWLRRPDDWGVVGVDLDRCTRFDVCARNGPGEIDPETGEEEEWITEDVTLYLLADGRWVEHRLESLNEDGDDPQGLYRFVEPQEAAYAIFSDGRGKPLPKELREHRDLVRDRKAYQAWWYARFNYRTDADGDWVKQAGPDDRHSGERPRFEKKDRRGLLIDGNRVCLEIKKLNNCKMLTLLEAFEMAGWKNPVLVESLESDHIHHATKNLRSRLKERKSNIVFIHNINKNAGKCASWKRRD